MATAGATFANTLSGVTNTGSLNIINNSGIVLGDTLTNNGSVNLISSGNVTDIALSGSQSILGSGPIVMSNTRANRIYGSGATLTLGGAQTITGAGTIGAGAANFSLANQGTIVASCNAGLLINASAGVTNTGTLRADGGTLSLQTIVNSGGAIEARNGSVVQLLNGAVIHNANFSASGAGSLITTVNAASVTLGGCTVTRPLTVASNSVVRLTGDLTSNGTLTLNSGGNFTDLVLDGARTIGVAATIQMSSYQNNRLYAANASSDALTLANGVTLQGAGQLGTNTALAITNNGTVIAKSGAPLLIETTAGLTNNGVMRADGGTLQLVLLCSLALAGWLGSQLFWQVQERQALQAALVSQQQTVDNAGKLRASLDALAADTQRLADAGNASAGVLVAELRKRGITINAKATAATP